MTAFTPCVNPATGEIIGQSPLTTSAELKEAVIKSRNAQKEWALLPVKKRVAALRPVLRRLAADADLLAKTISAENGKPLTDAMTAEVLPATLAIDYYLRKAPAFLAPANIPTGKWVMGFKRSRIHRHPFGVIGIISPWNYPFAIPFSEVIMALLAGNGVILKTASQSQLTGRFLETCIRAANLPEGLFSFVNMPGAQAGTALLENHIDKLFFTGSTAVGKQLMAEAAPTLTPLVLELGGNDAMLVCPDADVSRAASGAVWAGLSNAGQSCGGVERIYVHQDIYSEFLHELKKRVEALRPGSGLSFDFDLSVMTTAAQAAKVNDHIRDALDKGAVIFAQSPLPIGESLKQFIPATVLTEVHHDMDVMREETFGPVLGVMKVNSMNEAVALANDSHFGLTGSIWSRNRRFAKKLAQRIQAGVVTINDHLMSHGLPETPWGGFKQSGIGRTHGKPGFDEMTQLQVIVNDILPFSRGDMWWHPYNLNVYEGLKGLLDFLYAVPMSRRLKGLPPMMKILPRFFKHNRR